MKLKSGAVARKSDIQQLENADSTPSSVFMKDDTVVKKQGSAASMRTGSTNSGESDEDEKHMQSNNANETDKLL